jgi:hypothetical protein
VFDAFPKMMPAAKRRPPSRRGQSLVEFALVSFVLYLILAAILTFGHLLYCSQTVQQAADLAAREIARTPLPPVPNGPFTDPDPNATFLQDVLYGNASSDPNNLTAVRTRIFDDRYLVLSIGQPLAGGEPTYDPPGNDPTQTGSPIGNFPLITQQLLPVMINDQVVTTYDQNGNPKTTMQVLRYPGAVFQDNTGYPTLPGMPQPSGYLVRIPLVSVSGSGTLFNGAPEAITGWLYPIEPIPTTQADPFLVTSPQMGVVALRINYPYQSATMTAFVPRPYPLDDPNSTTNPLVPIVTSLAAVAPPPPGVGQPVSTAYPSSETSVPNGSYGPNGGQYGLGQQAAFLQTVRPYRKVLAAQAIYRREVFQ